MPSPKFFAQLGLFIQPYFLDTNLCTQALLKLRSSPTLTAEVVRESIQEGTVSTFVDERSRKTDQVCVSPATARQVQNQLNAMKPALVQHFGLSLTNIEQSLFHAY